MRKILAGLIVAVTLVGTVLVVNKQQPPQPLVPRPLPVRPPVRPEVRPPQLPDISEAECRRLLLALTDRRMEGRMSGKRGNVLAAEMIADHFRRCGLEVRLQRFSIRRMNPGPQNETGDDFTHNVIGVLRGESEQQIVIGAHFDHIGYGPAMARDGGGAVHDGADDNASGTVAVMLMATQLARVRHRHTLVFVAFSAEEMGLIGSRHYVSALSASERGRIDFMINFDMVGRFRSQVQAIGGRKHAVYDAVLRELSEKYKLRVSISNGDGGGGSDHASFAEVGIPVCFFHTGMHEDYHTKQDTADKINTEGLTRIAGFVSETVTLLDQRSLGRTVQYQYDMNYERDKDE